MTKEDELLLLSTCHERQEMGPSIRVGDLTDEQFNAYFGFKRDLQSASQIPSYFVCSDGTRWFVHAITSLSLT
jgi:hypothetical protein